MQQAWYRKYRPTKFSEVVGQEHVKTTLLNQVKNDKIAHAYLLAGPKGTGKTSMARLLAKAANCLESKGEPCGTCANCQAVDTGQMIDLIEIDAASHTGVDNIRELVSQINLAPSLGKYKVYVIDEAHMLSKGAFNALLKTLEEPPAHAIFVLATTEPHKFPATIISRCQRFDLRYLSVKDIAGALKRIAEAEGVKIEDDAVLFLAEQSEGSMRDGVSLLEQAASMGSEITKERIVKWLGFVDWGTVHRLTELVLKGEPKEAIASLNQLYLDGYDLTRLTEAWIKMMRQLLAVKLGNSTQITDEQTQKLAEMAKGLEVSQVVWWLEQLMNAANEIKMAVMPQIPLELMIVRATQILHKDKPQSPEPPKDDSTPSGGESTEPKPEQPVAEAPAESAPVAEARDVAWPEIVQKIREMSPTLGAMLGQASATFEGDTLVLRFRVQFYKEAMEQTANRRMLEDALTSCGKSCTIKCLVDQSAVQDDGLAVDDVMKVFSET